MSSYINTSIETDLKGSFLLKSTDKQSDASLLLGTPKETNAYRIGKELIKQRESQLGPNVSIFYRDDGGLVVTEGKGCYMYDIDNNKYLDCCNNVACVGHSHPVVVQAGCNELAKIQTNGRFLNPVQQRYLSKFLSTFPPELNTVYFVNSGSEANDLALRIARSHTKAKNPQDVICLDYAYHGHTQSLVDISPYKWAQAVDGKNYQPSTTHVISCPDSYRGKYRGFNDETGSLYANEVKDLIDRVGGIGTFIAESIVGCGGQIVLPPTYLSKVYDIMHQNGGVCIADEVQTGFARAGTHFWTFQTYGVIPDIVTCGKPMGNGYPIAAVVCRREVANSFAASGIEYFNTYSGNSVACAIAEAVYDTIISENLQNNALVIGNYMIDELKQLQSKYQCIGDIRGFGLFQGIEFIDVNSLPVILPNPKLTKFIVDFLRYEKVIISRDGPDENVIKIKPPIIFSKIEVDILVNAIDKAVKGAKLAGFSI
eukprot:gene19952-25919_t